MNEGDIDGFNIAYTTMPGIFEDMAELLSLELRRRGIYRSDQETGLTARENVYGKGQARLRSDHTGSRYNYDVYQEDPPNVADKGNSSSVEVTQ